MWPKVSVISNIFKICITGLFVNGYQLHVGKHKDRKSFWIGSDEMSCDDNIMKTDEIVIQNSKIKSSICETTGKLYHFLIMCIFNGWKSDSPIISITDFFSRKGLHPSPESGLLIRCWQIAVSKNWSDKNQDKFFWSGIWYGSLLEPKSDLNCIKYWVLNGVLHI